MYLRIMKDEPLADALVRDGKLVARQLPAVCLTIVHDAYRINLLPIRTRVKTCFIHYHLVCLGEAIRYCLYPQN